MKNKFHKIFINIIFIFSSFPILVNLSTAENIEIFVNTPQGVLKGINNVSRNVLEFKGVQYALVERFDLAKPVQPWLGIKDAMHFQNNCAQSSRYGLTEQSLSEDCYIST